MTLLRAQIEAVTDSDQGARARLEDEVRACHAHIRAMGEKMEEDHNAVQFQMVQLRETATAAAAVTGLTPQTFAVPVAAKEQMHLTQRKGFEGLPTYSGNAQWQEWRFTAVDWLKQENSDFESLLKKIEKLTEEPEEPADGTAMTIGGVELTPNQQWCCDELYQLLARKIKAGPKMLVRNLESLTTSRGA